MYIEALKTVENFSLAAMLCFRLRSSNLYCQGFIHPKSEASMEVELEQASHDCFPSIMLVSKLTEILKYTMNFRSRSPKHELSTRVIVCSSIEHFVAL